MRISKKLKLDQHFDLGEVSSSARCYECQMHHRRKGFGTMVLLPTIAGFYSKTFGRKIAVTFSYNEVIGVEREDNIISIQMDQTHQLNKAVVYQFIFPSSADASSAHSFLEASLAKKAELKAMLTSPLPDDEHEESNIPSSTQSRRRRKETTFLNIGGDSSWEELFRCATVKVYSKGDFILTQGERVSTLSQLIEGRARAQLRAVSDDEKDITLTRIRAGSIIGEVSWLLGTPCSANVVTSSDKAKVLEFDVSVLDEFLTSNTAAATRMYRFLGRLLASRIISTQVSNLKTLLCLTV